MRYACKRCKAVSDAPTKCMTSGCEMTESQHDKNVAIAAANIRTPLLTFACLMEQKLRKNDHKTGWRHLPVEALLRLMLLELEEFKVADEFFCVEEAQHELVDVANFAMMLHDRLGMLDLKRGRREQLTVPA